jgi:hypothetical protein
MPRPSNALLRRLKVETVTCHRCSTIIAAYPSAATRCGRRCTISIVAPQMARHPLRGFSDDRFPTSLKPCYRTSMLCHGLGNEIMLWR